MFSTVEILSHGQSVTNAVLKLSAANFGSKWSFVAVMPLLGLECWFAPTATMFLSLIMRGLS